MREGATFLWRAPAPPGGYEMTEPIAEASPPLANYLSLYNLAPGILGEGSLPLWLLVIGLQSLV
jgi:hypothetical protein